MSVDLLPISLTENCQCFVGNKNSKLLGLSQNARRNCDLTIRATRTHSIYLDWSFNTQALSVASRQMLASVLPQFSRHLVSFWIVIEQISWIYYVDKRTTNNYVAELFFLGICHKSACVIVFLFEPILLALCYCVVIVKWDHSSKAFL